MGIRLHKTVGSGSDSPIKWKKFHEVGMNGSIVKFLESGFDKKLVCNGKKIFSWTEDPNLLDDLPHDTIPDVHSVDGFGFFSCVFYRHIDDYCFRFFDESGKVFLDNIDKFRVNEHSVSVIFRDDFDSYIFRGFDLKGFSEGLLSFNDTGLITDNRLLAYFTSLEKYAVMKEDVKMLNFGSDGDALLFVKNEKYPKYLSKTDPTGQFGALEDFDKEELSALKKKVDRHLRRCQKSIRASLK